MVMDLIDKTVGELKSSSDKIGVEKIMKAINGKSPDGILSALQKSGRLPLYYDYWKQRSCQDLSEIKASFQGNDRLIIHVLIDLHVMKTLSGEESRVNFKPPANISYELESIKPAKSDLLRFSELIGKRAPRRRAKTMLEFAPTCIVTTGKTRGQNVDLDKAPYSRRPLELMDPGHQAQLVVLMWASQSMKSVNAQITACYYTDEEPSEILYTGADKEMVRKMMDRRYTPMVQALGVEFISSALSKGNKKTGDLTYSKEFAGGNIDAATANSAAALASETKRLFIPDELGLYRAEIGNSGNPFFQGWARIKTYMEEKKCLVPSTPGLSGACMVEYLFGWGTQEEWTVDCPLCGHPQILEVKNKEGYGLDWSVKKGSIDTKSIVYVCQSCGRGWKEAKNYSVQKSGRWVQPEDINPADEFTYSFHLHSINSQFEQWSEIAKAYERGMDDKEARQYYFNHVAGLPFSEAGYKPEPLEVMKNRGDYNRQTVPDGVLYLVIGADVQKGSDRWNDLTEKELEKEIESAKKDGSIVEKSFPRIEIETLGRGPSYRTWSIDYQIFYGKTTDAYSGAFEQFFQWGRKITAQNGKFGFYRSKDKHFFPIQKIFVDSGHQTTTVYDFCSRINIAHPVKGSDSIETKSKTAQIIKSGDWVKYKWSKVGTGKTTRLCTCITRLYKEQFYNWLQNKRIRGDIQRAGYQEFPHDYDRTYFEGLTSNEQLPTGEYTNRGRADEPLSCRVYGNCAADAQLDEVTDALRQKFVDDGGDKRKAEEIDHKFAIQWLSKLTKIDQRFLVTKADA